MNFIPYGKQNIDQEDINAVVEVLKSDFLTTGPKIMEFEKIICQFTGAKFAVAVSSGTAALHLASLVLLKKGDKVLTTPNSFLATSNAIVYTDSTPIFVDILDNGNIDLDACEKKLVEDRSIKAIYVVHFSGNPVDQEKLAYLKDKYNVLILEDCAHSLGSNDGEVKAGSCTNSECSILSFHPVKHLTTGEGGAITTNSEKIYQQLLSLRMHGMERSDFIDDSMAYDKKGNMNPWYYEMRVLGYNYRITDFQCALGINQFKKLNFYIDKRKKLAQNYDNAFRNSIISPLYKYDGKSSYHLYVVKINFEKLNITKAELFAKMRDYSIGLQVHYIPINKQPFYQDRGYGNEMTPIMDKYYQDCFSLPLYPSLNFDEQNYVIGTLENIINEYIK